jgi:hypothetical protein
MTVNGEVTMREELFESYLSEGENITVKALRANVINKQGLCFTCYWATKSSTNP